MERVVKNQSKKRYKVYMIKEGDPRTRYIDFVWAKSALEAEKIIEKERTKTGMRILKIRARATR